MHPRRYLAVLLLGFVVGFAAASGLWRALAPPVTGAGAVAGSDEAQGLQAENGRLRAEVERLRHVEKALRAEVARLRDALNHLTGEDRMIQGSRLLNILRFAGAERLVSAFPDPHAVEVVVEGDHGALMTGSLAELRMQGGLDAWSRSGDWDSQIQGRGQAVIAYVHPTGYIWMEFDGAGEVRRIGATRTIPREFTSP
ncbi:MAG TPA: hypothetical protein VF282_08430 [Bacillota bacterium]